MNKKLKSEVINLHKKETFLNKSVEHKFVFMLVILFGSHCCWCLYFSTDKHKA